MNINDISFILNRDINLRNAVRRQEEKLPPPPEHLNKQTLGRLNQINGSSHSIEPKKQIWTAILSAIAACLLLLISLKWPSGNFPNETIAPTVVAKTPKSAEEKKNFKTIENEHTYNSHVVIGKNSVVGFNKDNTHTQHTKYQRGRHQLITNLRMSEKKRMAVCPILTEKKLTDVHVERHTESRQPQGHKEEWQLEEHCYSKGEKDAEFFADTLGCEILQSPENRLIALQMLSDCEVIIERETQEVRNYLIEATFNVVPPSRNAILVIDENGDYNVVETGNKKVIEL